MTDIQDDYSALEHIESTASEITEGNVVDYLTQHPEFFHRHETLLAQLAISHDAGGAVSLLEQQVLTLRQRNHEQLSQMHHNQRAADEQLAQLIQIARSNEKQTQQLHNLTLSLFAKLQDDPSLEREQLIQSTLEKVKADFSLDIAKLYAAGDAEDHQRTASQQSTLNDLLRYGTPICGEMSAAYQDLLLNIEEHALAQSAAIVPIRKSRAGERFLLILGSTDSARFHPKLGTQFLRELARFIATIC